MFKHIEICKRINARNARRAKFKSLIEEHYDLAWAVVVCVFLLLAYAMVSDSIEFDGNSIHHVRVE